jgi:hypothetical protein
LDRHLRAGVLAGVRLLDGLEGIAEVSVALLMSVGRDLTRDSGYCQPRGGPLIDGLPRRGQCTRLYWSASCFVIVQGSKG